MHKKSMSFAGIDLGTSNSCCYVANGKSIPEVVSSPMGSHLTPSYISYQDKSIIVGEAAKQNQDSNPLNTFYEFKRVIGKTYEQKNSWKRSTVHWPFKLTRGKENDDIPRYTAFYDGELIQLKAMDLTKVLAASMIENLRNRLGRRPLKGMVITVPAHFDHIQRNETLQSVQAAEVRCPIHVINEPTAAIVAYAHKGSANFKNGEHVIVFDFGAGTLDVTCVKIAQISDEQREYHVVSSEGRCDLGGSDLDQRLIELCLKHIKEKTGMNIKNKPFKMVALRNACEHAKRSLSILQEAQIKTLDNCPPYVISRTKFEDAIAPELQKCIATVYDTLRSAGIEQSDVAHVIMCGGSSRVPSVKNYIQSVFPGIDVLDDINVDECVALGACLYAQSLFEHNTDVIQEVVSQPIGIRTGVNVMHTLVDKGSTLPVSMQQTLIPVGDYADISFYQGENLKTDENAYLGTVTLLGLEGPDTTITLQVDINVEGMVEVFAHDNKNNKTKGTIQTRETI